MARGTLAARLALWYTVAASALLVVATAAVDLTLVSGLEREDDGYLADRAHEIAELLREPGDDRGELAGEIERESSSHAGSTIWIRVLAGGKVIAESAGMAALLPVSLFPAASAPAPVSVRTSDGQLVRASTAAVASGGVVQVAMERSRDVSLMRSFRQRLWWVLALGVPASALLGVALARHGVRALNEIAATARRIRPTSLDERIATAGLPAEIATLATTFNDMLDRLQDAFDRLSRFSADLAHELRTPVQNLRGEVEVALQRERSTGDYRAVLASALEELDRLSRLIEQLLFLSRAENPEAEVERETVTLRTELERSAEFFEPAAQEAGVVLEVGAEKGLEARLDRHLLQRALANLLANALAHTREGGRIRLTARIEADRLRVEVADDGCGIAPQHLPHLGERFYRADPSRSSPAGGLGLGLAIVRGIAALHGGTVEIDSELGRGTRVCLLLPRRGSASPPPREGRAGKDCAPRPLLRT